jgi:hypothetical protein
VFEFSAEALHQVAIALGKFAEREAFAIVALGSDGLSRFLDDGHIDLPSNTVNRSIRLFALNRKNARFAGSGQGGHNWTDFVILIENCKLSGIDQNT